MKRPVITWNDRVRLVFSDVDETIADVYTPAGPAMISELAAYLDEGGGLFMVTGGSLKRVTKDIIDFIPAPLRSRILISHCSGAEVWGFLADGHLRSEPFYSVYEERFTPDLKRRWRAVMAQLVSEFGLRPHTVRPKPDFWNSVGRGPLDIMLDDRGPQITMEVVNGTDLTADQLAELGLDVPLFNGQHDLRPVIKERAEQLLSEAGVPVTPRFGGNFALDFAIENVSKTTSIKTVLADPAVLATIGLTPADIDDPQHLEIWGDKFSVVNGGTDRHMSEALPPTVRSIDFRQEDPAELPAGFNIVLWDGNAQLQDGLLEYLRSRH